MPPRARFDGEPDVLVNVFVKHVNMPNFLGYTEDMSGPKQPEKLLRKAAFFVELVDMAPKLTFSQAFLEKVLELSYEKLSTDVWKRTMSDPQKGTWKTSLAKQIRVACRHITQSQKTSWYAKIFQPTPDDGGSSSWHRDYRTGDPDPITAASDEEEVIPKTFSDCNG